MTSAARQVDRWTPNPAGTALEIMAATARDAADTWALQEWASRLAAKAPARDYLGQLRQLYAGVLERWRYVQEEGERVPGSPRALLGHVLGAWYNQGSSCPSPEACDIEGTPWRERGWGDCDDVSTLVAAGALALGMRPEFRVVRWPGGAHVSTLVHTPDGRSMNLDPVGEPEHPCGWQLDPPGAQVQLIPVRGATTMGYLGGWEHPTFMAGLGAPAALDDPHVVLTRPGDPRGPRVLAIPTYHYRLMARGQVEDGMPAIDQFGDVYTYSRGADVWAPLGCCHSPMGRRRGNLRAFGRRLRRGGRRIARVAARAGNTKIAKAFRKAKARLLQSPLVQEAAAKGLQALGVPPQATRAVLAREAALAQKGGRARIAELISQGKTGEAAKLIAKVTGTGLKRAMPKPGAMTAMMGFDGRAPIEFVLEQDGGVYSIAPVAGFERVGGWYGFGQLDITDQPTPGRWYRIKRGDTFFGVIGKAFNLKSGGTRLKKTQQVNAIAVNRRLWGTAPSGEQKWFPDGRISFNPRFACDAQTQVSSPNGGPSEGCFGIMWIGYDGEDPPPWEEPPPPNLPSIPDLPDEPEEPTVVVPPELPEEPDEPDEPDEPEAPVVIPTVPVTPAPPVEPVPPTPVLPPDEPDYTVPTCPPGQAYNYQLQQCVDVAPVQPPPPNYTVPTCPPGQAYNYQLQQCVDVAPVQPPVQPPQDTCPPGQAYNYQMQQCMPVMPVDPEPIAPVQPGPTGGGLGLWPLLALTSLATGSPLPLVAAAVMERRR